MGIENLKASLAKGDFRNEEEDNYIKDLEQYKKKNLYLKIGMGAVYILLLVVSLLVV